MSEWWDWTLNEIVWRRDVTLVPATSGVEEKRLYENQIWGHMLRF